MVSYMSHVYLPVLAFPCWTEMPLLHPHHCPEVPALSIDITIIHHGNPRLDLQSCARRTTTGPKSSPLTPGSGSREGQIGPPPWETWLEPGTDRHEYKGFMSAETVSI